MNLVCRQTGERTCSSSDLCPRCARALGYLIAQMPPAREYTAEEIELIRVRSAKGKK